MRAVLALGLCLLVVAPAVGQKARTLEELVVVVEDPASDYVTRTAAIDELAKLGAPALPTLVRLLEHRQPETRVNAATALGSIGPPAASAHDALLAATYDTDARVLDATMNALVQLGPESGDVLFELAVQRQYGMPGREDMEVQRAWRAHRALRILGAPGRLALVPRLRSGDALERALAADLLKGSTDPDSVAALIGALGDEAEQVRLKAVNSLAVSRDRTAVEPIAALLDTDDVELAHATVAALTHLGGDRAVEALIGILRRGRWGSTRAAAARALGTLGDPAAIPALVEALEADYPFLEAEAAGALGSFGALAEPAVPALASRRSETAARSLRFIGRALRKQGKTLWWVPLHYYAPQLGGVLAGMTAWFALIAVLLPLATRKIRGLWLVVLSSILTTVPIVVIVHRFTPYTWRKHTSFHVLVGLVAFVLLFLIAGRFLRRPSQRTERLAWMGTIATIPVALSCGAAHYVVTQRWVEGFLPQKLFVVLPVPIAAMLSVAFCCALVAVGVVALRHREPAPQSVVS